MSCIVIKYKIILKNRTLDGVRFFYASKKRQRIICDDKTHFLMQRFKKCEKRCHKTLENEKFGDMMPCVDERRTGVAGASAKRVATSAANGWRRMQAQYALRRVRRT